MEKDARYWLKRWKECYPCTYPPELLTTETITITEGWWIFKSTRVVHRPVCARCHERITTGHLCADLMKYTRENEWTEL